MPRVRAALASRKAGCGSCFYAHKLVLIFRQYCTNVLAFEAVLQLLLWRVGKRTSTGLLSDEEEEALHQSGLELIGTSDWVNTVLQRRNDKERNVKGKAPASSSAAGGTRTRPKRS